MKKNIIRKKMREKIELSKGITFAMEGLKWRVANGSLQIGSGTFESVGSFDASNSTLIFTGSGRLKLGGAVTSFGSFTRGTGTVEYNGTNQTVLNLNSSSASCYNNLEISGTGTKTLSGTSKVYGDLLLTSSDFNLNGKFNLNKF